MFEVATHVWNGLIGEAPSDLSTATISPSRMNPPTHLPYNKGMHFKPYLYSQHHFRILCTPVWCKCTHLETWQLCFPDFLAALRIVPTWNNELENRKNSRWSCSLFDISIEELIAKVPQITWICTRIPSYLYSLRYWQFSKSLISTFALQPPLRKVDTQPSKPWHILASIGFTGVPKVTLHSFSIPWHLISKKIFTLLNATWTPDSTSVETNCDKFGKML